MKKIETEFKLFMRLSGALAFMFMPYFLFTIKNDMAWLFTLASMVNFVYVGYYFQELISKYLKERIGNYVISMWLSVGFVILFTALSYLVAKDTMPHSCCWEDCPHKGRTEFKSAWMGGRTRGTKEYKAEKIHFYHPLLKYEEVEQLIK